MYKPSSSLYSFVQSCVFVNTCVLTMAFLLALVEGLQMMTSLGGIQVCVNYKT